VEGVLHGTLVSHRGTLGPGLLEGVVAYLAAQGGQGVVVGGGRGHVGRQPAGAGGLEQGVGGGQQADGAAGVVALPG
jgi:hypothetical protein